jgi:hypothetical protein
MNKPNPIVTTAAVMILALLGCLCSSAGAMRPTQTPSVTVGATAAVKDFTRVRLHKGDGDLSALITMEAGKALTENRHPYLEFDATWCPPCIAITETLNSGDPMMVDAFAGTYMIQVDIDEWKDDLAGAGYKVNAIPVYYELNGDGKSTGRTIDGGAWGDNIPENMAPPLKKFFQGSTQ